jgi:hypothetical protein
MSTIKKPLINKNSTAELSFLLSAQKLSSDLILPPMKLTNARIEAQGAAALARIQAILKNHSLAGSHINVHA